MSLVASMPTVRPPTGVPLRHTHVPCTYCNTVNAGALLGCLGAAPSHDVDATNAKYAPDPRVELLKLWANVKPLADVRSPTLRRRCAASQHTLSCSRGDCWRAAVYVYLTW